MSTLNPMEAPMLYKTITLELLQDHPQFYDQLLFTRRLLPTLERYARELRDRHLAWIELLTLAKPKGDPIQIASEAGELATEELQRRLPSDPLQEEEPLSLDEAMVFISSHMSPA
jgi:hypothetical protein